MRRSVVLFAAAALLAGCAGRRTSVATVTPPPAVTTLPAPPLPPGASPGMRVPAVLADGSYPTPNRGLSPAAALWHLRAGLNVAALACRGADEAAIVAGYNAMLTRHKAALGAAEAGYAAEFRAGGGDWRDRYDDAMTRLYNYFSQTPARPGFCAAASGALADAAVAGPGDWPEGAAVRLASLDRPFTDFYRAYDAWAAGTVRIAATPVPAALALIAVAAPVPPPHPVPRLELDASVFGTPETAVR